MQRSLRDVYAYCSPFPFGIAYRSSRVALRRPNVTLYRAEAGKLQVVREVIPQAEGIRSVRASGNAIFLIHPAQIPRAVNIIHPGEPMRDDDVEINPSAQIF